MKNLDKILGDLRHLNHLLLNKEVFNINKKPEIGSLMLFEIERNEEDEKFKEETNNEIQIKLIENKNRNNFDI